MDKELFKKIRDTLDAWHLSVQKAWPQVKWPVFIFVGIYIMIILLLWFPKHQLPESGLTLKERLLQENENRKTLAQILGGGLLLVGIYLTWRRIRVTEGQLRTMEANLKIAREGQITERFARAIEHLGRDKPMEVRLGAIYSLERIAQDSEKDHWPIMEVLTAYVREHAPWPLPPSREGVGEEPKRSENQKAELTEAGKGKKVIPKPRVDVQAILTVIGRRRRWYGQGEDQRLDLRKTDLKGADLRQAQIRGIRLEEACLEVAWLWGSHMEKAVLNEAYLEGADLGGAHLEGAYLRGAHLEQTLLWGAHMEKADLRGAHLKGADLGRAHLEGAVLEGATGLTWEQIKIAIIDEETILPDYLKGKGSAMIGQVDPL